jgi:transposase-like protein
MKKVPKYSPEFRERAVRLVFEHQGEHKTQWAAIVSIASKIGCTGETLRKRQFAASEHEGGFVAVRPPQPFGLKIQRGLVANVELNAVRGQATWSGTT